MFFRFGPHTDDKLHSMVEARLIDEKIYGLNPYQYSSLIPIQCAGLDAQTRQCLEHLVIALMKSSSWLLDTHLQSILLFCRKARGHSLKPVSDVYN